MKELPVKEIQFLIDLVEHCGDCDPLQTYSCKTCSIYKVLIKDHEISMAYPCRPSVALITAKELLEKVSPGKYMEAILLKELK
jgi:hypothetical protein